MGSSFAAGPGVGARDPESARGCARSAENYPHLVARMCGLALTDVTCSGATTRQILEESQAGQRPQISALRPETQLVTVTVGGNDISYVGNLLIWSAQDTRRLPLLWRLLLPILPKPTPDDEVDRALTKLPSQLTRIAEETRRRAPNAALVFVDYAAILSETDEIEESKQELLPLTAEHLQRGRYVAQRLAAIFVQVAEQTGGLLVRASEVTRDHGGGAADPWMEGFILPGHPFAFDPIAYHPNARGMRAVAESINAALSPLTS
jgi:lysophospholipase L1-like esterase